MNAYSSSEILKQATLELQKANIEEARFEAELLLSHLLNVPKEYFVHQNMSVDNNIYTEFKELIAKRKTRYPIQYLLGEWEFWSFQLLVSEGVFIPRPETETLVELALENNLFHCKSLIDLGTGTGNISIALAKEFSELLIFAVDISEQALLNARNNIILNGLTKRIKLVQSDFLTALNPGLFPAPVLIISNPPYISSLEATHLMDEIKLYEPVTSYLADNNGLECYFRIIQQLDAWKMTPLYLMFEIAPHLEDAIIEYAQTNSFILMNSRHDLSGLQRALLFERAGSKSCVCPQKNNV